jgi:hypothetical protein
MEGWMPAQRLTVMPAHSLYTTIFEQKVGYDDLLGLSCYMPDWLIPGQVAEQDHRTKLDEFFAGMEVLP